ncbi:MAG TPA: D-alanyl-D-alanine carboxypeptidase [Firmicutes bacterium]|nr:D-alanyl-D-alanine carboxypeptidase [Bacillota bacterium]
MKRYHTKILCQKTILFVLLMLGIVLLPLTDGAGAQEFMLQSKAALLMDNSTGEIIFSQNDQEKVFPASVTKIMTMLLALEALERGDITLQDQVPITKTAAGFGGSTIFLDVGDVVDVESLLIGIAVGSGNDAAVALAEYLAGSVEGFVDLMNRRAKELGMENTHFINPTGLHDEDHYTTAYDTALMTRELLGSHPIFFKWSTIWMDENFLEGKIKSGKVYLSNTNRLVRFYQGCDGVKTGYTDESLHSIVATAERNGMRFIAIAFNAPTSDIRYLEARQLLDFGFANFKSIQLAKKNEIVATLPIEKGNLQEIEIITAEMVGLLAGKEEKGDYATEMIHPKRLNAPLRKGDRVGSMQIISGNKILKEVDLIVSKDVEKASFGLLFKRYLGLWIRFGR